MEPQELPFGRTNAVTRRDRLVEKVVDVLEATRTWHTRDDLHRNYGLTDRDCRLARQYSKARIISGRRGYRATRWATADEIRHSINTLHSQAKEMIREALELAKAAHRQLTNKDSAQ